MPYRDASPEGEAMALPLDSAATIPNAASVAQQPALPLLDDKLLIERAQAGECGAFEELVHRYDRDVLRLALNILRSPEDARDVYQESFLKIYRNLGRFRADCSFHTWMYRIVTNVCLDHLRQRRSHPEEQAPELKSQPQETGAAGDDFFERQADSRADANPEHRMWGQELGKRIDAALEALSPRERMIFEMKHYQGLKLRVIGELLGTTEETVKNSLFRATRKLRAQLHGYR